MTENPTIGESCAQIEEEFGLFLDPVDKLSFLMEQADSLPPYPDEFRNDDYLLHGCTSRVWLYPTYDGHTVRFDADSDAQIPKGLVALILRLISGRTPDQILAADYSFVDRIGLRDLLSPNRANGLSSMIRQVKSYALGYGGVPSKE